MKARSPEWAFPPAARRLLFATLLVGAVLPAPTFAADPAVSERWRDLREQARALEHGEGVPKDPARAFSLYCQAAQAGDAEANYALGWMIANGRGVARDDATAAYFFDKAMRLGHPHAPAMLRFVGEPVTRPPSCMRLLPKQFEASLDGFSFGSDKQRQLAELIVRLAPEFGISPRLALAVANTESNLDPRAVSEKNAQGLMQLIPETSVRFNVRKPFDPEQNVRGGLAYLRWLLAYFRGDVALAVAAYNAGEGAVNRYRGIPPYPETRGYVQQIQLIFPHPDHPFDSSIVDPSPELPRILERKARQARRQS